MTQAARICVAKVGAAHGVRGEVRLWPFTEDLMSVIDYGLLSTKDGARQFEVVRARIAKDHLVAVIKGISTREDAERINGLELYIDRDKLPETEEGEYYHADLIGLPAVSDSGEALGTCIAVDNFGAGDVLEIQRPAIEGKPGKRFMVPMRVEAVPEWDEERLVIAAVYADEA